MEPLPGTKEFEKRLEYELQRVTDLNACPAIVLLRLNDSSLKEKVEGTLFEMSQKNVDVSVPGMQKQCLDYIANCINQGKEYIGIILEHGNGKAQQIAENILRELKTRCGTVDFAHVGSAAYQPGLAETAQDIISQASIRS